VIAHAREEALDVDACVEVEQRVERADHQRKAAIQAHAPHVAALQLHAPAHINRLVAEARSQIAEHRRREIDPRYVDAEARDRERDPPVAAAVLQHGPPARDGEVDVIPDVARAVPVRLRVVGGVFVVSRASSLELVITSPALSHAER
jgi:hypothetical protein